MKKEKFIELVTNRILYKIVKSLPEMPKSIEVGGKYYSETLYNLGYNMEKLVKHGYLSVLGEPYEFQKEIIGQNVKSVFVKCGECGTMGINDPLNIVCGNCGYPKCVSYYDAETINDYIQSKK